jgi:hypothetical protein
LGSVESASLSSVVMWFVILEFDKDRVKGVNTPGQQVPPHVQYGTTCLLVRDVVGGVPCSNEWKIGVVTRLGSHCARGVMVLLLAYVTPGF